MKFSHCSKRRVLAPCTLKQHQHQVDPYIGCAHLCRYCYALNQAETDWSEEILLHPDIERQLGEELEGLAAQSIYMGWKTDPYQPCETDLLQTRKVLELLRARGFSASILTKSDLILRDLDILRAMDRAAVSFSIAFEDDAVRKRFEAGTIPTESRIKALKACKQAGLKSSAMVCPVIPYINDPLQIIEQVRPYVDKIWVYGLSILDESEPGWRNIQPIMQAEFPEQYEETKAAIFNREHPYWADLRHTLTNTYSDHDFELSVHV